MADTIREQIIKTFTARLASISTLTVERARRSRGDTDERFITVWDGEETSDVPEYNAQRLRMPIAVDSVWNPSPDNPSTACSALLGEIIQAIMGADHTFGGLSEKLEYQSATPTYPSDGSEYVELVVIFIIQYSIGIGDPFTAA